MRAVKYIGRRLADRAIDLVGIVVATLALIVAYTATAATVNVVIPLPEPLLPGKVLDLIWELGNKCLQLCFE